MNCPREIYYSVICGLRSRRASEVLTRGTWVHALLEARARGLDWKKVHADKITEKRLEQFEEEIDFIAEQVYKILTSYDFVYRRNDFQPIAAELTVERPMFDKSILYRGRIDLVARDSEGDIWLVDHKTHQNIPEWDYRELAFQHYSYLWACKKSPEYLALGIPQPKGFVYDYCRTNAIQTPTLTKSGSISRAIKPYRTTYPVMLEWLISQGLASIVSGQVLLAIENPLERNYVEGYLKELKHQNYHHLFRRDFLQFSAEQEKRQIKAFMTTAKRMLLYRWDNPDCVERNLLACSGFMCNFKDLTTTDLIHGSSELEQQTRYIRCDPLGYYPKVEKGKK